MGIYYTGALFKVAFTTYAIRWCIQLIGVTAIWVVVRGVLLGSIQ